ncbi:SUMF1/EgtB/PvdO family nonheme iron enzyme [bacterium]|nr:SUMF1/EgtB/PvdO family nonheme iron enzyme [bacterium]
MSPTATSVMVLLFGLAAFLAFPACRSEAGDDFDGDETTTVDDDGAADDDDATAHIDDAAGDDDSSGGCGGCAGDDDDSSATDDDDDATDDDSGDDDDDSYLADEPGENMVQVPAGPFWMGCNPDNEADPLCGLPGYENEQPFHQVELSEFWIDKTEVSFEAYDECVAAGECQASAIGEEKGYLVSDEQPAIGVNREMARTYCRWLGRRLPTEAEWEKAGRGEDGRIWPWGNVWQEDAANWADCVSNGMPNPCVPPDGYNVTAPVDAYGDFASPYGALNLSGNVWEWVADNYDSDYYADAPSADPQGPREGALAIVKGGAWKYDFNETWLRLSHRNAVEASGISDHVGFRCAWHDPNG